MTPYFILITVTLEESVYLNKFMKFKKRFRTFFFWRRKYRQLVRRWQEKISLGEKKQLTHDYFSWKHNTVYKQIPWYWQRSSTNFKK